MLRFIFPALLVVLSITSFVLFTSPTYKEIAGLKVQAASYDEALTNALNLEKVRDSLSAKYHSLTPDQIDRLQKLLPDNVDNIRLIIDLQHVASTYGMVLTGIKFDTLSTAKPQVGASGTGVVQATPQTVTEGSKAYGTFDLEFTTQASYDNFLLFLKDLEKSLRIVDISSISFTSDVDTSLASTTGTGYKYGFKIKTYWLKN